MSINVSGITGGGSVALLSANGPGSFVVPAGPCAGTVTGLSPSGAALRSTSSADGGGMWGITPTIPGAACGAFVQALDLTTCSTSPAVPLAGPGEFVIFTTDLTIGSDAGSWLDTRLDADMYCADYAATNGIAGSDFRIMYSNPGENAMDYTDYAPGAPVYDRDGVLVDEIDIWSSAVVLPDAKGWTITGTGTDGGYLECDGAYDPGAWPICQYCEQKFACGSASDAPFMPSACCWTGTRAVVCMGSL
jgi:hypothetical protein